MVSHSLAAAKRLRKELQVLQKSPDDADILLEHNPDNLLQWKAWIRGPVETPYEGGVFELDIRCGTDYPLAPPSIKFITKVSFIVSNCSVFSRFRIWCSDFLVSNDANNSRFFTPMFISELAIFV